ncbi:MAG: hypothetical protein KAR20_05820, partial [Candidatus Heimdallarchaeota archaeon]|nr:hypothetical protein [Candidatus Heimdallarchaeota archaeon]
MRLKKEKNSGNGTATPAANSKAILRNKLFLIGLLILVLGNVFGILFMSLIGTNPNHLGTVVYEEKTQVIEPNSIFYYSAYLNASKNSIAFKSDINVEFYLVDVAINES